MDPGLAGFEDRGPGVVACGVVGIVISTIAVAARFWSNAMTASLRLWWDDWAILTTMVASHTYIAIHLYWTTIGLGKHQSMISPEFACAENIASRVSQNVYALCICFVKISGLLFYARIFKISRIFVASLRVVGAITIVWCIASILVPWSFCNPVQKPIHPSIPGECFHSIAWYYTSTFINCALDLAILILPLPIIWKLQMAFRRKLILSLLFLVGYTSMFLSLSRFIIAVVDPDIFSFGLTTDASWDLVPLLYITMLESPIAILALCTPSIKQLVTRVSGYCACVSLLSCQRINPGLAADHGSKNKGNRGVELESTFQLSCYRNLGLESNPSSITAFGAHVPRASGDSYIMDTITINHDI
ncbi:hypothetical protein F5Y11DRAFT_17077 [Daldinia sp. FL1419]|nr:hypothetical protein F5Y11DRAFT_17077 [Daldinia sp. FL1419]